MSVEGEAANSQVSFFSANFNGSDFGLENSLPHYIEVGWDLAKNVQVLYGVSHKEKMASGD